MGIVVVGAAGRGFGSGGASSSPSSSSPSDWGAGMTGMRRMRSSSGIDRVMARSSRSASSPLAGRCEASLAVSSAMKESRDAGIQSACSATCGMGSLMCMYAVAMGVSAWKGSSPVRNS
jgi:hypothetical protein